MPHWQPEDRKEDIADDIRDWVHKVSDPHAKLETLTQMSKIDLVVLMLAIRDSETK